MANGILDIGLQGLDWYQQNQSFDDARSDINRGYDAAAGDVKRYQEPYQQFGLEHMQGYDDLGEFSFSNEDFYRDPSYQWRMDQGLKGVQRSNAANKMLASGNTLQGLTDYGQNAASQEYQAAYDRSLGAYDTNRAYHQYPIGVGAEAGRNIGDNLADMSIGRGDANAQIEFAKSNALSNLISGGRDTMGYGGGAGGGILGGIGDKIGDAVGGGLGWLGDQAKGLLGGGGGGYATGADAARQIGAATGGGLSGLGGGAGALGTGGMFGSATGIGSEALGTGAMWGSSSGMDAAAMGVSPANYPGFGGDFSAAMQNPATAQQLSSAATQSFGSWAGSAAAGVGAIFALRSAVDWLRGQNPDLWGDAMEGAAGADDPLAYINSLPDDKLPVDTYNNQYDTNLDPKQARGALYSSMLQNMPPEAVEGLKYHNDIGNIVNSMMSFASSGSEIGGKHSAGGDATKALKMLFPEIGTNIDMMYASKAGENQLDYMDQTSMFEGATGYLDRERLQGGYDVNQYYAQKQGEKAGTYQTDVNVRNYIQQQMAGWNADKLEGEALEGLV